VESSIRRNVFFVTSEVTFGREVALSLGALAMSDSDPNTPRHLSDMEASLVTFEGKSWKLENMFVTPPPRHPAQRNPEVTRADQIGRMNTQIPSVMYFRKYRERSDASGVRDGDFIFKRRS
jgi:hypothetical protein